MTQGFPHAVIASALRREGDRANLSLTELARRAGVAQSTLSQMGSRHARRDLYVVELGAGAVRAARAHTPGSLEHVVVAAGRLRTGPAEELVELGAGDYAAF